MIAKIKIVVGEWLRELGYRTGDPYADVYCALDIYTPEGYWLCSAQFLEAGALMGDELSNTTSGRIAYEYAHPDFLVLIYQYVFQRHMRCNF